MKFNGVIKKLHVSGRLKQNLLNILAGRTRKGPIPCPVPIEEQDINIDEIAKNAVVDLVSEELKKIQMSDIEKLNYKILSDKKITKDDIDNLVKILSSRNVRMSVIDKIFDKLDEKIVKQTLLKSGNTYLMTYYASWWIASRWPEAEHLIVATPDAYFYAKNILKSRWPEAEKAILSSLSIAYYYAKSVIKGRWPEAEEVILNSNDELTMYYYAKDVIKSRWPEAEPKIAKNDYVCKLYNRNVLEKAEILSKTYDLRTLKEMAVEYDPKYPERMHPKIQADIEKEKSLYGKHPAFPKMSASDKQKFAELLSSKRFKDVLEKVRKYAGKDIQNVNEIIPALLGVLDEIVELERDHREILERLAVSLVMQDNNIKQGEVDFDAKIVDPGQTNLGKVKIKLQQEDPLGVAEELQDIDLEVAKRRFINGLIHGAAEKGQYMFHLAEEQLKRINPDLPNMYGLIQSLGDYFVWIIPEMQAGEADDDEAPPPAGKSEVDLSGPRPKIIARAINFPLLINELVKGVMELISMHGLPKEKELRKKVLNKSDFLDAEIWDRRFGPGLWEKFTDAIGAEDQEIRSYLYGKIVEMPAQEFHDFMRQLMSGTKEGKQKLSRLAKDIRTDIKRADSEDALRRKEDISEQVKKKIPLSDREKTNLKFMTGKDLTKDDIKNEIKYNGFHRLRMLSNDLIKDIIVEMGPKYIIRYVLSGYLKSRWLEVENLLLNDLEYAAKYAMTLNFKWPELERKFKEVRKEDSKSVQAYYSYMKQNYYIKKEKYTGEVPNSHQELGKNIASDVQKRHNTEMYKHPIKNRFLVLNVVKYADEIFYFPRVYLYKYPYGGTDAYKIGVFLDKNAAYNALVRTKKHAKAKRSKTYDDDIENIAEQIDCKKLIENIIVKEAKKL